MDGCSLLRTSIEKLSSFPARAFAQASAPYFPQALTSLHQFRRAQECAELFPASLLSGNLIYECDLQTARLDFSLDISTQSLPGPFSSSGLIQRCLKSHIFDKMGISRVWLEFDLGTSCPPIPNLFMLLENREELFTVLDCLQTGNRKQIEAMLISAEKYGLKIVKEIGFMGARKDDWVKICLRGARLPEKIEPFLQEMLPRYSAAPLLPLLKKLEPLIEDFDLSLDIRDQIHPKIAIECYPSSTRLFHDWTPFLQVMQQEGLIDTAQKSALLSWKGGTIFSASDQEVRMIRHSYFKLVYEPGRPLKCKAYLCTTEV